MLVENITRERENNNNNNNKTLLIINKLFTFKSTTPWDLARKN